MIIAPAPLGEMMLPRAVLDTDKTNCLRCGPCGVGKEALYLGGRSIERRYYLPWREVKRVFKRVAMTSGGFSGKGIFGTLSFLVVQYGAGKEKEFPFKLEGDVDKLLSAVEQEHPNIPTHSKAAEKKLAAAEAEEKARYKDELSPRAQAAAEELVRAQKVLEENTSAAEAMVSAAKQKRVVDNLKPAYRVMGALCAALGILLALWGAYGLTAHSRYAGIMLLAGGVLFLFALTSNTLPSRWTSKKRAQADWDAAVAAMERRLAGEENFPVPARYAHPVVLRRMLRVIREGRAEDTESALATVKEDLRALNASVTVSQKEHDEVVAVKPLFLVSDYQ